MNKITRTLIAVVALSGFAFLSGCATQQTSGKTTSQPSKPAKVEVQKASSGYGPSHTTFDRNGVTYVAGSMAYPTGVMSSSSVLVEKTVPKEAMVGSPYAIEYVVKNLTDVALKDVVLKDTVGSNFRMSRSSPEANEVNGSTATWIIGDLDPRGSVRVVVNGSSPEEGFLSSCADLTFVPAFCETVRIVKGNLQLVKSLPSQVSLCDPIPMRLVVTNTGSSRLTGVVVSDSLPSGLRTADGQTNLRYDVGTMNPGETREFTADLRAASTGSYDNEAVATSAQDISASDGASVVVKAAELVISCDAPSERFIGRPITVCYTVLNSGSASASNAKVVAPIPSGMTFQGATSNGRVEGNSVVWYLGNLSPEATKELCATFTATTARRFALTGTASGDCVDSVSSTCSTLVQGIPAILLEVIDLEDPIEDGSNVVYQITVTNQGSAPATNVRIVCELEAEQRYVSTKGTTAAAVRGQTISLGAVPAINPGAQASWLITVKAIGAGDVRFAVQMDSDQMSRAVNETESTNQY